MASLLISEIQTRIMELKHNTTTQSFLDSSTPAAKSFLQIFNYNTGVSRQNDMNIIYVLSPK